MKGKSNFILCKLPPITEIVSFMETLDEIYNKYSKSFPLWFIIIIATRSTLAACSIIFICIQLKCNKNVTNGFTKLTMKPPSECEAIEMMPSTTEHQCNLNAQILKAFEECLLKSIWETYAQEMWTYFP